MYSLDFGPFRCSIAPRCVTHLVEGMLRERYGGHHVPAEQVPAQDAIHGDVVRFNAPIGHLKQHLPMGQQGGARGSQTWKHKWMEAHTLPPPTSAVRDDNLVQNNLISGLEHCVPAQNRATSAMISSTALVLLLPTSLSLLCDTVAPAAETY